ncbi:toxin C-terminal domain-containing protein [Clavibacter sepedonicus]|uniref:toxin C-terminal domain-containing protein n=1 Tax=Clavibacter TaxID=1573 RepID=UPI001CC2446A
MRQTFSKPKNPNAGKGHAVTDKEAAEVAKEKGYTKIKARSAKGRAIFKKGKNDYITYDRGSDPTGGHNGGYWKRANSVAGLNSKTTRGGTWDKYLTKRIGD